MTDPQDVHGGECSHCQTWFTDNEHDLNAAGHCDDCAKDLAIEALDDARAAMEEAAAARIDTRIAYENALQHTYDVGADLSPADLSPADLSPADLSPADLSPVDLSPADLSPADLSPADLSPVDWLAVAADIVGVKR